jgi:multicomponent Na+:H+ antiporter subunit B
VTPRARIGMMLISGAVLLLFVLWGFAGLPGYGHYPGPYGTMLNAVAPRERHSPNVITAVNFDYRGLDTLGEEYVLFAAVAGFSLVLRNDRRRTSDEPLWAAHGRESGDRSEALRAFSTAGVALTIAFGVYMAIHPHLTPGGGFQGGAIAAGFAALTLLGLGYATMVRIAPQDPAERLEAIGASGYAVIGIATLIASGVFLANVLPLGREGDLFSAGTIPLINLCVALEVCAGFIVLFAEFARETRVERPEDR